MLSETSAQSLLLDVPAVRRVRHKKPRLGRYEGIRKKLETDSTDTTKVFVEFAEKLPKPNGFSFIDLFCGAGA